MAEEESEMAACLEEARVTKFEDAELSNRMEAVDPPPSGLAFVKHPSNSIVSFKVKIRSNSNTSSIV